MTEENKPMSLEDVANSIQKGVPAEKAIQIAVVLERERSDAWKDLKPHEQQQQSIDYWPPQFRDRATKETGYTESTLRGYWQFRVFQGLESELFSWMNKSSLEEILGFLSPLSNATPDNLKKLLKEVKLAYDAEPIKSLLRDEWLGQGFPIKNRAFLSQFLNFGFTRQSETDDIVFPTPDEIVKNIRKLSPENLKTQRKLIKGQEYGGILKEGEIHKEFQFVVSLIEREPIDEQSFIALFCLIFSHLRNSTNSEFSFKVGGKGFHFYKIKYLQTSFPDLTCDFACLPLHKNTQDIRCREFKIELEFDSANFIKHGHHHAKNFASCELIICWKNSLSDTDRANYALPPIIEISQVLKEGKIKVIG